MISALLVVAGVIFCAALVVVSRFDALDREALFDECVSPRDVRDYQARAIDAAPKTPDSRPTKKTKGRQR